MEHKHASSSERKRKKELRSSSKEPTGSKKSESSKDKDDKHGNVRSRHYAYISPETVSKIAESIGIPSLHDDIAVNLAEDVSYKLQEIIHASCSFMRCCKRRKLLTSDVKSALQTCDAPPVYGHNGDESTKFVFVPEADVYVTEDAEVDLISVALGSETYTQTKPRSISTSWPILMNPQKVESQGSSEKLGDGKVVFAVPHPRTSINGESTIVKAEVSSGKSSAHISSSRTSIHSPSSCTKSQNELAHNPERSPSASSKSGKKVPSVGASNSYQHKTNGGVSFNSNSDLQSSINAKNEIKASARSYDMPQDPHISQTQLSYFNISADLILCGSKNHFEVVVADLRTNEKLGMVVPYFLNLVAFTINRIPRQFALLQRLFNTVDALLSNQYVNPSYSISVNRVVNALLAVTSDHRMLETVDDFQLRRTAAHLLARVGTLDRITVLFKGAILQGKSRELHDWLRQHSFKVFAEWNVEDEHVSGLLDQLCLVLRDNSEPVQSHYGALVIFQALGYPVLSDYLAPILHNYLPRLQTMIDECPITNHRLTQHLQEIRGVILSAAEVLYSGVREGVPSISDSKKALADLKLDRLLYEYFGDSVCARRRHFPVRENAFFEVRTSEEAVTGDVQGTNESEVPDKRLYLAKSRLNRLKSCPPVPNTKRRTHASDVFEATVCNSIGRRKDINFTFAGANPVPKERLRRKALDRTHAQSAQYVRSPSHNLFQTQTFAVGKQRRGRNIHVYSTSNRLNLSDTNMLRH